jgi:hypothetical protein
MQLEHQVVVEFKALEGSLGHAVDWTVSDLLKPAEFVDRWRILLRDHAFVSLFEEKAPHKFAKGTDLMEHVDGVRIVHRVLYR